jgi:hypothetical protein
LPDVKQDAPAAPAFRMSMSCTRMFEWLVPLKLRVRFSNCAAVPSPIVEP